MVKKLTENNTKEYYQWQDEAFSKEEFAGDIRRVMQDIYPIKNTLREIERKYFVSNPAFDIDEIENYYYDNFESALDKLADCYSELFGLVAM